VVTREDLVLPNPVYLGTERVDDLGELDRDAAGADIADKF
jgi:hypothetical protein